MEHKELNFKTNIQNNQGEILQAHILSKFDLDGNLNNSPQEDYLIIKGTSVDFIETYTTLLAFEEKRRAPWLSMKTLLELSEDWKESFSKLPSTGQTLFERFTFLEGVVVSSQKAFVEVETLTSVDQTLGLDIYQYV